MGTIENTVEVLNDLLQINNDRITGYEHAIDESKVEDLDLKAIFETLIAQSKLYKSSLEQQVIALGGSPDKGTTNSGKIYRVWMDVKATFTGHDRKSVLENCEFGEDAAQKAYKEALSTDNDLPQDIRSMIVDQQIELKVAHDKIKGLRDAQS
ncbi:ferritin-like domain-containing protein [Arcticibacter eurypsychrophilus]|uniref:ferritin-like domain-containing protein n=1 Tax=Arcticibacter eurypsychrophilus TaxID=1434752 RepID=UPI00084DC877|nr:PA2169 family four-helix-bundle protein [Arcticibacter eurypsychrophilus]